MSAFAEFLRARLETGGFTTEDALASLLPLAREVQEAHAAGFVAPLEDVSALQVDGVRIWFEHARRQPPKPLNAAVSALRPGGRSAVEVVSETRVSTELNDGQMTRIDLSIGSRTSDQALTRPVYLPGYACWEHRLDCHDPISDVFSLGMILASLACGLDFHEPEAVEQFVAQRRNLFALAPKLHPVVARAIVRMTELDRTRRPQDLPSLIAVLEHYRYQDADLELDLVRAAGASASSRDKQTVVLRKLRERLFDISRRNRLLHFRPTAYSVSLTQASVPLSFDVAHIRPDQILTWNDDLQQALLSGHPLSLNKYLNFVEMLFLPNQLTGLIADTRRDEAEFGFAQLRLVICFLHWANLKEDPIQQFDSPLLLLPVRLSRIKGIRDVYQIEALGEEAEVNPVVRHQFNHLYNIDLPPTIDLAQQGVGDFFTDLARRIQASDAAVTLTKIDRPRIAVIYEKARRKLDTYQRRARLAGAGIRSYRDLDYSYDPANYYPLGIRLFNARVRPAATHLRSLMEDKPRPRAFAVPPADPPVAERERQFYSLESGGCENPYDWTFDLCSVTLANFRYQRMSLVRDYEALLENGAVHAAFEAVFSLAPRPLERVHAAPRALDQRFDVVACDPTQASAIVDAETGGSYIIQGPPGTGKSQTIANLIADYVARGKRVLFVCEKRAAIDVVYARLQQVGLGDLCCLIHDSQTDKKAFVMDLKHAYERLAEAGDDDAPLHQERGKTVRRLKRNLATLDRFSDAMRATPPQIGLSVRRLLETAAGLRPLLPQLDFLARERLPHYVEWLRSAAAVQRFEKALHDACGTTILADHPLRLLSPRLSEIDRPLELVTSTARELGPRLERLRDGLRTAAAPTDATLAHAQELVEYARHIAPLAATRRLDVFVPGSEGARQLAAWQAELAQADRCAQEAAAENAHWRDKLPPDETAVALERAQATERSLVRWLQPTWWRLRRILRRAYDFSSHRIQPSWSRILGQLLAEHEAQAARRRLLSDVAAKLGLDAGAVEQTLTSAAYVLDHLSDWPAFLQGFHANLVRSPDGAEAATRLTALEDAVESTEELLVDISDDGLNWPVKDIQETITHCASQPQTLRAFLGCLRELRSAVPAVATVLRVLHFPPRGIEAALADRSLELFYESNKEVADFNGASRDRCARNIEAAYDTWLRLNAAEVRRRSRARFLENLRMCEQPASGQRAEQKELKRRYNRGRRELEHEFGKQMRYRPIRELVANEPGEVVKDLKPVWLMSPLSVADTLPLDANLFDVAIFDEASQITLEDAVPTLCRAPQTIVVGDEMQLPPTDFFAAKRDTEEDEELLVESESGLVQYDLDADSLLSHSAKTLPATMLGWHYRSRSESLISFSNRAFYGGELLTVPEEARITAQRPAIHAATAADGRTGAAEVRARPISYHKLTQGVYDKRRNRAEAEYIAELVAALLATPSHLTIGIIAFSEAQQGEIEQALNRLAQRDPTFAGQLEGEYEREVDGQFVGLLVKNLENIQGDERDIVILSICYGHAPDGGMRMNFGPINKSGGEKRLNVAFSRAKHHMAVISSIESNDITNDYNEGARCLKNYLRYAQAASLGDTAAVDRVLHELSRWARDAEPEARGHEDTIAAQLAAALTERGCQVAHALGQSQLRCDLAVCWPDDAAFRLGILVDGEAYHAQRDVLERDMLRPRLLRAFGWRVMHVLAKDWYADSSRVIEAVLRRLAADETESVDAESPNDAEDDEVDDALEFDPSSSIAAVNQSPPTPIAAVEQDVPPTAAGQSTSPTSASATRRLEYREGRSCKFWEITLAGTSHTVRFGRIGTAGQTLKKTFPDEAGARRDRDRLVQQKLGKGYADAPSVPQ